MISQFQAAKNLCRFFNWSLNQWQMHNLLWYYDIKHSAEEGNRLINDDFRNTAYGPILKDLFQQSLKFESYPVEDIFFCPILIYQTPEVAFIKKTSKWLLDMENDEIEYRTQYNEKRWPINFHIEGNEPKITKKDMINEYERNKARFQT